VTAHETRAHAVLGASSAHRWMACPGSVRLSAAAPPRASSRYADEGTAAHQLAEWCLRENSHAADRVGTVELVNSVEWEVTEEMADAVQVFVDTVRAEWRAGDTLLVEQRFDLSGLHGGMFGTNDACVVSPSRGTLFVFDYKHGKGHAVEAVGNPQLRYYGLGALMHLGMAGIHTIVLTIVQPRAPHRDGPVRRETISAMDLLEWTADLRRAARATEAADAPVNAGEWCTFCPAAGTCPALRDKALESAMADFAGAVIKVPADPGVLTPEQMARLLDASDLIDKWLAAVRAHALHLAESGGTVPGYKLVDKRATRKWRDDGAAPQLLSGLGLDQDDIFDRKLRSPAQVEKLLPKEKRGDLAALVVKESSGVNLVRDDDARPSRVASAIADFAGVL
jgi:hypothetical protein